MTLLQATAPGSGRDTAWLVSQGFDALGFDASDGLLQEARFRHPGVVFAGAELPALAEIDGTFTNALCETVVMHLDATLVAAAVRRLVDLLEPNGTLYLSWRVTEGA